MEVAAVGPPQGEHAEHHPVRALLDRLLQLLQLQLHALLAAPRPADSPLARALSPVVGSRLLWALRRFTSSYLMPDEASASILSPSLLQLWGRDTQGGDSPFVLSPSLTSISRRSALSPLLLRRGLRRLSRTVALRIYARRRSVQASCLALTTSLTTLRPGAPPRVAAILGPLACPSPTLSAA